MKRYILNLVAIFAAFVLSACGGGGGGADTTTDGTAVVPSSAVELVEAGTIVYTPLATTQTVTTQAATAQNFSLQVRYSKNLNDNYLVKVYTQSIVITGCTIVPNSVVFSPDPVVMDQNTNSTAVLNITGQVDAACTNTTDYTLLGEVTVQLGDQITKETLNVSSVNVTNPTDPTDSSTGQYSLTNVTTPIVVNYDNEIKAISVYVVDENGVGIVDQNVSIQAVPDMRYGQITSASTVQTDSSGRASFVYEAPADVKAVDGEKTYIDLLMLNNGVLQTKTVEIIFNKINENISLPIVVIDNQYKDINLTNNSQSVTMEIRVFEDGSNTPYTQGAVKVKLPSKVLDGIDVGTFSEYNASVGKDGIAKFTYTGPRDLWSLVNKGDISSIFEFYHEDNTEQRASITVHYEPSGSYQPSQYILSVTSSDGNNTMNLQSQKSFTIDLKDDQGTLIDSSNISEINITTENANIGILVDENNGVEAPKFVYDSNENTVNPKSFHVKTGTLSGIVPIRVSVKFKDANNNSQIIEKVINIIVFSGPPTAMSISYVGVEHNATIAKFIEKFVVTVTDAYNNPVNTQPYISTGAMVEYAVDGNSSTGERNPTSPRLWHGADDDSFVTLENTNPPQVIADDPNVFRYIDIYNDKLVLFGAGYVYEALGKWDILSFEPGVLDLNESYQGDPRERLLFAVGHNNRQDLCSSDAREYVGNMRSGTYKVDENGHAFIEFEYDYHLTGKDVMIWVNLSGFQADNGEDGRIGEAQKHTLRGAGFKSNESYIIPAGSSAVVSFYIHHKDISEWYRNGHFGYAFNPTACSIDSIIDSSNQHDARDCNNVIGYLIVNVSNPGTEDCTIELNDESIAVAPEFNSGLQTY